MFIYIYFIHYTGFKSATPKLTCIQRPANVNKRRESLRKKECAMSNEFQ